MDPDATALTEPHLLQHGNRASGNETQRLSAARLRANVTGLYPSLGFWLDLSCYLGKCKP